jgi:hypothetical protein
MDLSTTYTHDSELITALSLISTLYKSPQHPLSLFQPALFAEGPREAVESDSTRKREGASGLRRWTYRHTK